MQALSEALPPTFTAKTARDLGVHPRELYTWRDAGEITELSRGVFRRADAPPASYLDILAVAYRAPRGIICCLSAAVIHELTDDLPGSVQVAIPKGSHPPQIDYPPATVLRFDANNFELGLSAFEAAPEEQVRVYDAARTVTDLMRLRHRFGEPAAHTALHRYLTHPGSRPALLLTYARALGVFGPVRTALDIATAR
jgi:predicted transcriptional regulator of viral defense system